MGLGWTSGHVELSSTRCWLAVCPLTMGIVLKGTNNTLYGFIDSANIIFRSDFQLMFHKIKECHYDRRRIEWQVLSSRSKDLIRKMLDYEHLRLTAKECLSHEFIQYGHEE